MYVKFKYCANKTSIACQVPYRLNDYQSSGETPQLQ